MISFVSISQTCHCRSLGTFWVARECCILISVVDVSQSISNDLMVMAD